MLCSPGCPMLKATFTLEGPVDSSIGDGCWPCDMRSTSPKFGRKNRERNLFLGTNRTKWKNWKFEILKVLWTLDRLPSGHPDVPLMSPVGFDFWTSSWPLYNNCWIFNTIQVHLQKLNLAKIPIEPFFSRFPVSHFVFDDNVFITF